MTSPHGRLGPMFDMIDETPPQARWSAGVIALATTAALVAQTLWLDAQLEGGLVQTLWEMARYFTILTGLLVVATMGAVALNWLRPPGAWLAALTVSVVAVGIVYRVLLAHLWNPTGLGFWGDEGLHTAMPVLMAIWWVAYAPKQVLRLADLPVFALWPSVYGAYALGRGLVDGVYPYPFLDPGALGPTQVALNFTALLLTMLFAGLVMIGIGRFLDR